MKNVFEVADARQKQAKKRSLCLINEHFESVFNTAAATQIVFQRSVKPWQKQEWCIPEVSSDFVAAMEDVLDLYEEPYDPMRPVVCFDESPKQLIAEVRKPLPLEPGTPARYDTEYERKGVCDLMMICEPKRGFRQVDITDRRTKIEFVQCMKHIADIYPQASVIRVVLDNLNTHKTGIPLRGLSSRTGARFSAKTGISLHPQARQLVEHCRNRAGCVVQHVSDTTHSRQRSSTP
ncbi:MAG: transposase [Nitrosomonas sp.]|nr:transposase [Nitrosomonas sp.]MDP3663275.1 transposase [Nitrosomonas sp.]